MPEVPVFSFENPWVTIIVLLLSYVLPRIVGLVSDRFASSLAKGLLLGALSVVATTLTFLLDIAVADTWSTLDWSLVAEVAINAAILWVISQQMFDRVIKPSGQAAADAERGVSLLKAAPGSEDGR